MTWGSHCLNCGRTDCGWVRGPMCEGKAADLWQSKLDFAKQLDEWLKRTGRKPFANESAVQDAIASIYTALPWQGKDTADEKGGAR